MLKCDDCPYAERDYCEYYGGTKAWFVECGLGREPEECEGEER